MTSTFTSYAQINRDLAASLKRKAADPVVARDTAYFEANIGKVTTVDAFLADRRLYAYAMKAYGLEDMIYAKAFMRKVLTEGAGPSSFAGRLADDRYVAFAKAFDFGRSGASAAGTDAVTRALATTPATAASASGSFVLSGTFDFSGTSEARFSVTTTIDGTTRGSATITLNARTLAGAVQNPAGVTVSELLGAINGQIAASGAAGLAGKVRAGLDAEGRLALITTGYTDLGADGARGGTGADADTVYEAAGAARAVEVRNVALSDPKRTARDIGFGTAVSPALKAAATTQAYRRQALEADAGAQDTGVRLALYFARKAPEIASAYAILSDPALSQVVSTVIGLPATSGAASSAALDRRAKLIADKVDLASLKDPAKLDAFVRRFTAIWDAQNNAASAPVLALFDGTGASAGLTADMLVSLQRVRSRS